MLGVGLVVITLLVISSALCCGLVTWALAREKTVSPQRAFAWGALLGPFGLIPASRERRAQQRLQQYVAADSGW